MVMTSDAIRYDLARIGALIAALNGSYPMDEEDRGDLRWLWRERAFLLHLLASRRAQADRRKDFLYNISKARKLHWC